MRKRVRRAHVTRRRRAAPDRRNRSRLVLPPGPGFAYGWLGREIVSGRVVRIGIPQSPVDGETQGRWFDLVIRYAAPLSPEGVGRDVEAACGSGGACLREE